MASDESKNAALTPTYNGGWFYTGVTHSGFTGIVPAVNPKLVISVDWFEACYRGILAGVDADVKADKPAPEYKITDLLELKHIWGYKRGYEFDVLLNGEAIGQLTVRSATQKWFRMENGLLYTSDWTEKLQLFEDQSGLILHNYTRIDIAIDGSGLLEKFSDYYLHRRYRLPYGLVPRGDVNNATQSYHSSVTVGSPRSDMSVSVYAKGRSVLREGKQYIIDYWRQNDLTDFQSVCRVEARLKGKILSNFSFRAKELQVDAFLVSLFRSTALRHLTFVEENGTRNVSRLFLHYLIDLKEITPVQKISKAGKATSTYKLRILHKWLWERFHSTGKPVFREAAEELFGDEPILKTILLKAPADMAVRSAG
jgi:hypothetical protein